MDLPRRYDVLVALLPRAMLICRSCKALKAACRHIGLIAGSSFELESSFPFRWQNPQNPIILDFLRLSLHSTKAPNRRVTMISALHSMDFILEAWAKTPRDLYSSSSFKEHPGNWSTMQGGGCSQTTRKSYVSRADSGAAQIRIDKLMLRVPLRGSIGIQWPLPYNRSITS